MTEGKFMNAIAKTYSCSPKGEHVECRQDVREMPVVDICYDVGICICLSQLKYMIPLITSVH